MFTVSDFLKQLQAASDRGRRERFKPFFTYAETGKLDVFLSPKEGLPVQIAPSIEMIVDGANREEILGFRFHNLAPPPLASYEKEENEKEIPF